MKVVLSWLREFAPVEGSPEDLADAQRFPALSVTPRLAITCLDQVGDEPVTYRYAGRRRQAAVETFIAAVVNAVGAAEILLGFGADRLTFRISAIAH